MILTGKQIVKEMKKGNISIFPFVKENLNPNSYNLTLSPTVLKITDDILDVKKVPKSQSIEMGERGYLLEPNNLYLMATNEYTITKKYVPMITGRSTGGRYGIQVHQTAGFGDIGFSGVWTLEVTVKLPIWIYPNISLIQTYFVLPKGGIDRYNGTYQYQSHPKLPKPLLI